MPSYCPSCGAVVKEGSNFCLSCGAKLQKDDTVQTQQPTQSPATQQQIYTQPQPITPMQPKKTNMKIIVGIIAIIVVVIVVALVIILFIGGGATDSRFVGEWEQFNDYISVTWNFKSGGSLEIMDIGAGTWSVNGDKLCINPSSQYGGMTGEMCYNFEFSNDGNTLTLTLVGIETAILTKK